MLKETVTGGRTVMQEEIREEKSKGRKGQRLIFEGKMYVMRALGLC